MKLIVTDNDGNEYVFNEASVKILSIKYKQRGRSYTATLETDIIQKIVLDREVTKND